MESSRAGSGVMVEVDIGKRPTLPRRSGQSTVLIVDRDRRVMPCTHLPDI